MSMKKKRDQEIFILKVMNLSIELKSISLLAYNGLKSWSDFLEEYAEGIKKLKEVFESEGMGGL